MTTLPSRPDSHGAQLGPGGTSTGDVLIFDNSPSLPGRIFDGIFGLAIGIVVGIACIDTLFNPPFSGFPGGILSLILLLGMILFGFLCVSGCFLEVIRVERLLIDFSQQTYHRSSGDLWDVKTATGSLSEVSHLCFRCFYQVRPKGNSSTVVQVLMVWENDARFILKADCPMFGNLERLKEEMRTYAEQLAARLGVPVIEDVEG